MAHPIYAEMRASREGKLNSMVGKRNAHHEMPDEKGRRLATGGTADGSPDESDMPTQPNPVKQTTHFMPQADFDPMGTMGRTGPSLGEAQTDEVGAERRATNARGGTMRGERINNDNGASYGGHREDRGNTDWTAPNYDKKPRSARGGRIR